MKNGIYTQCNIAVSEAINKKSRVISLDKLAKKVLATADFSNVTEQELRDSYVRHALSTTLSDKGWYSVVRGKGFYTTLDNSRREYRKAIADNISGDIERAEMFLKFINSGLETAEIDGQMIFNPETMEIEVQITEEELLEMLKAEAAEA